MKRISKKTLKIIAATAMSIFTLFSVFSASLAWFESIRKVGSGADSMPIKDLYGKFKQMTFHPLASNGKTVSIDESACSFSFNKTPSGTISYNWDTKEYTKTGTTTIALQPYETLDRYQPMLLLVELQKEYTNLGEGDLLVSATVDEVDGKGFIGERNETTNQPEFDLSDSSIYERKNNINYYWLSSVVRFFSKSFSSSAFTTFSSGSTYDLTLGSMNNQAHFVEIDSSDETSIFNERIDVFSSPASSSIQYIAVIVDYFPEAIEFIYSTFLGDDTLESAEYDYELNYLCDWKMEVR